MATSTVLITGSSSGIGKEVARQLARRGFHVILGCRNRSLALKVKRELADCGEVEVGPCLNLASLQSIRAFVTALGTRPISILINNAGMNGTTKEYSEEGVPMTMQVNYVGPYLLSRLLLPNLRKSPTRPLIVNVASIMHRFGRISSLKTAFTNWKDGDYPNSKLALVMFSHEWQRRYGMEMDCCCVDPGASNTKIFDTSPFDLPPIKWIIRNAYSPPEDAALTILDAIETPKEKTKSLFFARGSFAWPLVTMYPGHTPTLFGICFLVVYVFAAGLQSLVDYPLRKYFGQMKVKPVPPVGCSNNAEACLELWKQTEQVVELSTENHTK